MLDLARRKIPFSTPVPYIGCSKHSCLLCAEFIHSVGLFYTRGCHGKVYNLWMVPEQNKLEKSSTDAIYSAVQKLEHRPRDVILERVEPRLHSKESTVGGSSIATTIPQTNNQHLSNLIRKRLHDERGHLMLDAVIERSVVSLTYHVVLTLEKGRLTRVRRGHQPGNTSIYSKRGY